MIWQKTSDEKLLAGVNWFNDLDGATIVGTPVVEVLGDGSVTATLVDSGDTLTKFWIEGGDFNVSQRVAVTVMTTEGETLQAIGSVYILP